MTNWLDRVESQLGGLFREESKSQRKRPVCPGGSLGGSLARTGEPSAVANTSHNADNQVTQFGAAALTYDANGNLTSDGTSTYTWGARNQLVGINGAVTASFAYDAFGRRVSKNTGVSATYLYDEFNIAEELVGSIPTTLLSGGVDETFARTDTTGLVSFLVDALGSTVALTNSTGNVVAQYTYEPFGNTTTSGASTNPYQYTGRENDGTGLYYYRARYYSPVLQRFISEDPLGFTGGSVNLYAYVANLPLNFRDPFGLTTWPTDYHVINDPFGTVEPGLRAGVHMGVDIMNPLGGTVYSTDSGTVIAAGYNDRAGNYIVVLNSDGSVSGYAHTDTADGIVVGTPVAEGQPIGSSDASGNISGPHLHLTFRECQACPQTDPLNHLSPKPVSGRKDNK